MDKYTKLTKIGKGSFGCAYLATRKNDPLAKKYVIKEIRMDPRDQQSALREAKLLAALDRPNIIACKESFLLSPPPVGVPGRTHQQVQQQQQVLCIVTEYADGGDLRKKLEQQIAKRALLKEQEILDLFVQICLALKHLHDRKIIHRDIKPENIFLMQANAVKLGLKKAAAGTSKAAENGASPLDDPIILVQNLPDCHCQAMEPPPSSASNTGNSESSTAVTLVSPPPAPVAAVAPDNNTVNSGVGDGDAGDDEEVDEEEVETEMPVNLEFERMVLQLKSVVESSDLDDEPTDSDDEELDGDLQTLAPRIPEETEEDLATVSPSPPAYDDSFPAARQLKISTLEDPSFTKALRALLDLKKEDSGEIAEAAIVSAVASEQKPALLWMRDYVAALTSLTAPPQ